ncbi:MAG: ATP-binding cassette domain-containing protein [Actinomycetota bacterium]
MSGDLMVDIQDCHITYRSYLDPMKSLRNLAVGNRRRYTEVHAVRGIDLQLHRGEYFGIVGLNGSGKSTLLQAMTGLLPIEQGSIRVKSRPRLLGVGAALRSGVSGRRNMVLGGLALGIPRAEIEAQLDDLVAFVDIGDAIDRPMRTYSAGQRARLLFSIATMTPPEILLVDEALVVGDAAFKERSSEKIEQILGAAGTVVMVTHNVADIANRCDRAMWLHDGVMEEIGPADMVVDAYLAATRSD